MSDPREFTYRYPDDVRTQHADPSSLWREAAKDEGLVPVGSPWWQRTSCLGRPTIEVRGMAVTAAEAADADTGPASDDVANWFTYHPPTPEQIGYYQAIRSYGAQMARSIESLCPSSRERSTALAKVREAVMWANAAIACSDAQNGSDTTSDPSTAPGGPA